MTFCTFLPENDPTKITIIKSYPKCLEMIQEKSNVMDTTD